MVVHPKEKTDGFPGCAAGQLREQLHAAVAEEVRLQPEALRAGPWMLDCADDPRALPEPRELRKDHERMLKVGGPTSLAPPLHQHLLLAHGMTGACSRADSVSADAWRTDAWSFNRSLFWQYSGLQAGWACGWETTGSCSVRATLCSATTLS